MQTLRLKRSLGGLKARARCPDSFQVKSHMADAPAPTALDRSDLRRAYRQDEEACIAERLDQAAPAARVHGAAAALAIDLIEGARAHKASGIDAFLQQYGLDTEEGIALMCLAEALLRVPDAATADALIRDKIGSIDWASIWAKAPPPSSMPRPSR